MGISLSYPYFDHLTPVGIVRDVLSSLVDEIIVLLATAGSEQQEVSNRVIECHP